MFRYLSRLNNSSLKTSLIIFISRVFGYIRDMLIAAYIGISPSSDALMASFKLTNLFRSLFSEGAMSAAVVPTISNIFETRGEKYTKIVASHIFSILLFSLIMFTAGIFLQMKNFILITNPGFIQNTNTLHLAINLAYIMFPYLIFISAAAFYGSILYTQKIFIPYASTSIILNIILIISLYLCTTFNILSAVYAFACGVFISGVCELLWMIYFAQKYNMSLHIVRPRLYKHVKLALQRLLPGIFGAGILQISVWCDMLILSFYVGGISCFYFADRIIQLPLAIFSTVNSIVLLQSLSKSASIENKIIQFNKSIRFTLCFIIPSAGGLFVLANQIIKMLFMRESFDINAVHQTGLILKILCIALPFQSIGKIYYSAINASGNTKIPVKCSTISLSINILLSILLMKFIDFACVAVATVISSIVQCYLSMIYLKKECNVVICKLTIKDILIYFFAAFIMISCISCVNCSIFILICIGIIVYSTILLICKSQIIRDFITHT